MSELTPKQAKALEYIRSALDSQGSAPTLRELCDYMGFSAIGSAQDIVAALRKKGFLEAMQKQAARALILTGKARAWLSPTAADADEHDESILVPCLGYVPAGNPLEAIEARVDTMRISPSLLPRPRPQPSQLFAVKTSGLSMLGAGIFDGDWLITKCQNEAESGQIIIARVDGAATCKRLMLDNKKGWYLKPENPDFKNIYARDQEFEIVGRVVALQRSL